MNLHQLLVETEIKKGNMLLESMTHDMDHGQRYIVENIYNELRPLIEASLTADQIGQLFQNVEQQATAAGGNRTGIGKVKDVAGAGVDAVKKANEIINNAGKWLQNTKPVQNFDAKFEKLKNDINKKFPDSKILDAISNMGLWAQENPGKTAAIVGVLTAIASLAAGPVGGAIAGQVLRGSVELLKGEKLSTAIGKGIKTAALGYLSGKAFEMLGDWMGGLRANVVDQGQFSRVNWDAAKTTTSPGYEWTQSIKGVNIKVLPDDAENINFLTDQIRKGGETGLKAFDKLARIADEVRSPEYKQMLADIGESARNNDSLYQWIQAAKQGLQAVSQGAVAGAGVKSDSKESIDRVTVKAIFEMIDLKQSRLDEGPMDWLRQKGKNLTTKVTADKLMSAWKKAGSPTDSDQVAQVIRDAGVDDSILANVFKSMKLRVPKAAAPAGEKEKPAAPGALTVDDIVGAIAKMRSRDVLSLQKAVDGLLGGQPSSPQPAAGGAGAFGQMTNTLAPAKSSTGGTVTKTKTGLTHTRAPGNPSAPANSPAAKPKVVRGGKAKAV